MNTQKVAVRSGKELELMRKSGKITASALKKTIEAALPGISLLELEKIADEEIKRLGGEASFKTVSGYNWATCLTVNDEVVHGIPRDIKLQEGDVLGIDTGAVFEGWHSDAAWTILVHGSQFTVHSQEEKKRFLEVGEKTLWEAIGKAVEGNHIGDISATIQAGIERAGFNVIKSYAGHGVGKSSHEDPTIATYGRVGDGLKLRVGQTLAIEVIYAKEGGEVKQMDDGWTVSTKDKSLAGLFEMSVVVGKGKPDILTDWRTGIL